MLYWLIPLVCSCCSLGERLGLPKQGEEEWYLSALLGSVSTWGGEVRQGCMGSMGHP